MGTPHGTRRLDTVGYRRDGDEGGRQRVGERERESEACAGATITAPGTLAVGSPRSTANGFPVVSSWASARMVVTSAFLLSILCSIVVGVPAPAPRTSSVPVPVVVGSR